MKIYLILCFIVTAAGCLLGGCAADEQTAAGNPYPVESTGSYAHGEVSATYGHTVGH
jgi:hypothetical protein